MSGTGIRVELAVDSPADCPVAAASAETDGTATDVARSPGRDGEVVEEFTASADLTLPDADVESVFDGTDGTRYRFERDVEDPCFCELVEAAGCPVADVRADDGELVVTFHAESADEVRDLVGRLRRDYDAVSLRSLHQDGAAMTGRDAVVVDRGKLTDRQREVVETADEMGYFEYPKGANAGEVAEALDISVSTLAEHLAAAQTKILDELLVE